MKESQKKPNEAPTNYFEFEEDGLSYAVFVREEGKPFEPILDKPIKNSKGKTVDIVMGIF